ncbi:hypothetical protein LZ554_000229 [Drepanopeziza brunnea f. sp. 'monogermtubi']|nr:hypothetical protein LZ554_000229 [Drepanopeziza brunnea f. sp. 'monogermtubi']
MATISNLPALVRKQFKAAQENGDLTFYATRVEILQCDGISFQLRFSPALGNKPISNKPKTPSSKPFDPFEDPPAGLFLTALPPFHYLVLNKFLIIPNHFILATKDFKQQADLLEKEDLEAAYACLKAYKDQGEELFGFFNCGDCSGASQPHRHIQFLPVQSMKSGIEDGSQWHVLANDLIQEPRPILPFSYFSAKLSENPSAEELHRIYLNLYDQACQLLQKNPNRNPNLEAQASSISYNLGLTDKAFILCPRTSEGTAIQSKNGAMIGPISLNGTVLGGTLLVKSEEEWDALRDDESKLTNILSAIGVPSKPEYEERL